jgi:hypothetical protein
MQTVTTLPVLQAVSDSTDHYLGLQPIIKGRTNAEYVNSNLRFNPSSNTLTLDANLNLRRGSVSLDALSANVLPLAGGTVTGNLSVTNNFSFNSGYGLSAIAYGCRAWVNFNGESTVAIRASGNVSSITDNGTGDYTVNFINAMPDANYTLVNQNTWVNPVFGASGRTSLIVSLAAGNARIRTGFLSGTAAIQAEDQNIICVAIFR